MNKRPFPLEHVIQGGQLYSVAYKVVTDDMKSLGLRRNPNIMQYHPNMWITIPDEDIRRGSDDFGGMWLARTPGAAKVYQQYMRTQHDQAVRIFQTFVGDVLFVNRVRVKTDAVYLFHEIENITEFMKRTRPIVVRTARE
jgi:hypothetical protein